MTAFPAERAVAFGQLSGALLRGNEVVMISLWSEQLRGSMPPLVTPFVDGAVDLGTYASMVDWHADEGSHGVVVCSGSTGESGSLSTAERHRLAAVAVDAADGRVEVVVAIDCVSRLDALQLADHAGRIGAAAIIVEAPPSTTHGSDGLADLFVEIAMATELPVLVHTCRDRDTVDVDLGILTELALFAPNFVGLVQSSSDLSLVTEALITFGRDFRILAGAESFAMMALGAQGAVDSIANVVPRWVTELYYAVAKDGFSEGRVSNDRLFEVRRVIGANSDPLPLKYMMWRLGLLPSNEHRRPLHQPSHAVTTRLDALLVTLAAC